MFLVAFPVATFAFEGKCSGSHVGHSHTRLCLQAACNQVQSVNDPTKTACVGRQKCIEIMHVLPLNWFLQESDNLAPDIVQGISGWHLAEWSLSVVLKAVQLAFKMSWFVFSQTLSLQFAPLFLKTPNVKTHPSLKKCPFLLFTPLVEI